MDSNYSQTSVENGANPEMIWGSIYEYLLRRGKFMEKEFKKRRKMRQPQPFTWNDIDNTYTLIKQDLDDIVKGTGMYFRNTQSQSQPQQSPSQLQQQPQQGQLGDSKIPRYNIIKEYNQNNCNRKMRNKKVVRLTESQLHNIIAESVNQILNEMTLGDYNGLRLFGRHEKLLNKVDPRTYADRIDGINSFGRLWNNNDVNAMLSGAEDSFDYQYSERDFGKGRRTLGTKRYTNSDTGEEVIDYEVTHSNKRGKPFKATIFEPKNYTVRTIANDFRDTRQVSDKDISNNPGWEVARQMQKGSNGKGWRNNI